ncbi:Larp4B [Symbiodinium sp. KB8]|nr:Larp4B [Symbiodinium sp. KB8]
MQASAVAPTELSGDELLASVRTQIEHYFSKENLTQDQFLVSQMNAQFFVPLRVVADFARVRAMTTDLDVIRDALRTSSAVALDPTEGMVRPNIHSERTTIILREIAADVGEEAISGIFTGVDGCPKPVSVRSDVGDIWFVTMASEKEAQAAIRALRGKQFRGEPLRMRLKSENALRVIVAASSRNAAAAAGSSGASGTTASTAGAPAPAPVSSSAGSAAAGSVPAYAYGPQSRAAGSSAPGASSGAPLAVAAAVASGDLVGPMASAGFAPAVPTHLPAVTYTADQILAIAQGMGTRPEDVALPEAARVEAFSAIYSKRPNPELLHRQRTQSVEASLASGRPRFDSVASVDVTSMHYGDAERRHRKSSAAAARGVEVLGQFEPPQGATTAPGEHEMAEMMASAFSPKPSRPRGRAEASADGADSQAGAGDVQPASSTGAAAPGSDAKAAQSSKPAPYAAALLRSAPATAPKPVVVKGHSGPSGKAANASTATAPETAEDDAAAAAPPKASEAPATAEAAAAPAPAATAPKASWGSSGTTFAAVLQRKNKQ